MANRYWVGGSGYWSDDDNHWATSSGGPPANGNIPTSSDDVFIDSNSGFGSGGTITLLTGYAYLKNLTCNSGHSYTITDSDNGNGLFIYGNVILESGITFAGSLGFQMLPVSNVSLTTNGVKIPVFAIGTGTGKIVTLQDDLDTIAFQSQGHTFDANDNNIKSSSFNFYAAESDLTILMGSGIWEIDNILDGGEGYGMVWNLGESGYTATITRETSTIKLNDSSSIGGVFIGGGKTYNDLYITGTGIGYFLFYESNTFNEIKIDTSSHKILFNGEITETISNFIATGSSGNLIVFNNKNAGIINTSHLSNIGSEYAVDDVLVINGGDLNSGVIQVTSIDGSGGITGYDFYSGYNGSNFTIDSYTTTNLSGSGSGAIIDVDSISSLQFTLSKSSGTVECDYLNISNSNATGGATWYAGSHSVDTTNNDGWLFDDAPEPPVAITTVKNTAMTINSLSHLGFL